MGDLASSVFKWSIKFGFFTGVIASFVILLNIGLSMVFVTLNGNVLSDLFGLIQIGLPFNLSVLLGWLTAIIAVYVTYRLALYALTLLDVYLG